MISRRRFLELGTLAGASFLVPKLLQGFAAEDTTNNRKLVILQLSGGNDGLNTLVPFRNDVYYRSRPTLALQKNELLRLNDEVGLHPSLKSFRSLYDDGALSVLNSVGYPQQSRSHFQGMDFWHTAGQPKEKGGWLGRYLDAGMKQQLIYEIDETASLAVKGRYREGQIYRNEHIASPAYPDNSLAARLNTVAGLMKSGSPAQVYYVSHGSFDTHVGQREHHAQLLRQLDESVGAFVQDLKQAGKFEDVLILTFSEFGRRVAENEHKGTDHGAANAMFAIGGSLKRAGLYNDLPDLSELEDGDVPHEIDFRQVYATVLERWLGVDAKPILGRNYQQLRFV